MTPYLKTKTATIALFALLSIALAGCHKDKAVTIKVTPLLTSFGFETTYNSGITKNYSLTIASDTISGKIPPAVTRKLIASFTTTAKEVLVNNVVQESNKTITDFSGDVVYTLISAEGVKKNYTISVNWNYDIPHIYITTENSQPIVSKEQYLAATVTIAGNGGYSDFAGSAKIKGRGNTTWQLPKKPYRLKLDSKAALFGLAPSKNWVLLANYLDPTLMLNSVAMKTGQLLGIPYTNHTIPVDLTVNNVFAGSYVVTEQVEVATGRVPIENGGVLLELDQNFDEPWEFKSDKYQLPVMLKYPDITSSTQLDAIRKSFEQLESLVYDASFPGNEYSNLLDIESLVNYCIVYNLTDNEEMNHPKSTFMYKPQGGKFFMGPIWDFDWAYGYEGTMQHFSTYISAPFWTSNPEPGTFFFSKLFTDPAVKTLYKQKWAAFKSDKLALLLQYVDDYAKLLESSRITDYTIWHTGGGNVKQDVAKLRAWLQNRASYIDTYTSGW
jgi:hypothetical protein